MDDNCLLKEDFVHLARLALAGRSQDVQAFLHSVAKKIRVAQPDLSKSLISLIRESPTRATPLRRHAEIAVPVDSDSRFQLLRIETRPELPHEPVYSDEINAILKRLIEERKKIASLFDAGLEPTRSVLFTGPPGVGKTLAARWISMQLDKPLIILDLSAVMSSYLGRTGANLRQVLDFAKTMDCVLLLDELDAIAKRRDDTGEIGELKRLVTVLLQQLDDWPSTSLLVAATNHSSLLDPAIWRRFEQTIDFALPTKDAIHTFLLSILDGKTNKSSEWSKILSIALAGKSFSEIEKDINAARRAAAINNQILEDQLPTILKVNALSKDERINLALNLVASKVLSQRQAHEVTGVARETIRKKLSSNSLIKN
jgi:SpoVK/Ycf46/Vps4 family AAA+-type ATPase